MPMEKTVQTFPTTQLCFNQYQYLSIQFWQSTDCLLQCFALCVGVGANCISAGCEDSVKCSSRKLGAAGSSGVGITHGHY